MKNTKGGGAPRLKKIYIRTMNSDKQSIKNQGGGEPKPYQPNDKGKGGNNNPQSPSNSQGQSSNNPSSGNMNQNDNSPGMPGSSGMPNSPSQNGGGQLGKPGAQNNSDQGGGANIPSPPGEGDDFQKNFKQSKQGGESTPSQKGMPGSSGSMGGDQPPSQPPKDFSQDDLPTGDEYPPKKSNKKLFIILLIIILALGAAVAVYFLFLSPSDSADNTAPDQNQEEQTDEEQNEDVENIQSTSTDEEGDIEIPTVPSATSSDDESTSTDEQNQQDSTDESSDSSNILENHESLLSTPADEESVVTLSSMNLSSFASALEFSPDEIPHLREVVFQNSNENVVQFGDIAQIVAPSVFTNEVISEFQNNATFVTYSDSNGTWFGLAAELQSDADAQSVQGQVQSLEENVNEVRNFFLSDPGSESSWQDGGAGDVASRYITFSNNGSSFNYGWDNNTLIIGTSYATFQQIVNNL